MTEHEMIEESKKRGLYRIGTPVRFENEYVVRRGILTIVTVDGQVY